MTQTRWIGGPFKEIMPAGIVAATYNLVENEIPIYYPAFYNFTVRSIYRTELSYKPGSLVVLLNNDPVEYIDRGSDYKEMEITERTKTGYLRFFYTPFNESDLYGTVNLAFNQTRTWINQKTIAIDRDVINQIRLAISNIETTLGLVATRWTGGTFADSKGSVSGVVTQPLTYKSNIYNQQTLYVKGIFQEISDRVLYLAGRTGVITTVEEPKLILSKSLSIAWIEAVRTIINNIERII